MLFAWILSVWIIWRHVDACVHSDCECSDGGRGKSYDCESAWLSEVPTNFHKDTFELTLLANRISWLNNDTFDDYVQLYSLDLSENTLTHLPNNVFSKNTALEYLNIYDNTLIELPQDVFSNNLALRYLNLEYNTLTDLPIDVFSKNIALESLSAVSRVKEHQLFELKLGWNKLTILPTNLFAKNTALTELNIRDNLISSLPSEVFRNNRDLSKVNFQGNLIVFISADLFDNNKNIERIQLFCLKCFNCKCISVSVWNWIKKRKNDLLYASFSCVDGSILPSDKIEVICEDNMRTLHSASADVSMQLCLCQETTSTNQITSQTSESPFRYQTSELMKTEENLHTSTIQTEEQHLTTESLKTYSVNSTEKQSKQTSSETPTMYTIDLKAQTKEDFATSTVFEEATMIFDRPESTQHPTMQTLEQHPKTEIVKAYSVNSTEKQGRQTRSETSTMYTTNLQALTEEFVAISTILQDPMYTTIFKVLLGIAAPIIIIAVLTRLKGGLTAVKQIRHGEELGPEEVDNCLTDSIEFISSLNGDNSIENFRNIPPRLQQIMTLEVDCHKGFCIDSMVQTNNPSPDTRFTIENEC